MSETMKRRISEFFKTTVVCIRHAESEHNASGNSSDANDDPPLTDLGVKQAKLTAEHLQKALEHASDGFVTVYCSPLVRAKQTLDEFRRHDHQPLKIKDKHNALECMLEYRPERQGNAENFVDQTFVLFNFLQRKTEVAVEPQTIMLFGHSLLFSTLFTIIACHQVGISKDEHRKRVLDRIVNREKPHYLNAVYQLPNCSISVATAEQTVLKGEREARCAWNILSVGKCDHLLKIGLSSGHLSEF